MESNDVDVISTNLFVFVHVDRVLHRLLQKLWYEAAKLLVKLLLYHDFFFLTYKKTFIKLSNQQPIHGINQSEHPHSSKYNQQ